MSSPNLRDHNLIVIDDLVNHGETFLELKWALKNPIHQNEKRLLGKMTLQNGLVVLDREEGGIERLNQREKMLKTLIR